MGIAEVLDAFNGCRFRLPSRTRHSAALIIKTTTADQNNRDWSRPVEPERAIRVFMVLQDRRDFVNSAEHSSESSNSKPEMPATTPPVQPADGIRIPGTWLMNCFTDLLL